MKKINFLGGQTIFLSVFFVFIFSIVNAQSQSKFDRNFRNLLENKSVLKNGKINDIKAVSPFALQKISSKTSGVVLYSCIIYTDDAQALKNKGIQVQSVLPKFVTALVTIDDLLILQDMPEVKYVKSPSFRDINNDIAVAQSGASLLHAGILNNTVYKGKGVLVGVLDTGIYYKHPDFIDPTDPTKSRILKIWDQTLTPVGSEVSPSGFSYGVEYTQSQINSELSGTTTGFVREEDTDGHGTHVSGSAAGNGNALQSKKYSGMAPEANYIFVKGGNGTFSETNIINGLTYFNQVATALKMPIVVNMSLGGQYSAHDGTGAEESAVDNFSTSGPGRVVVIAAGNDNGTNIHQQTVINPGQTGNISFNVPADTSAKDLFGFLLYSGVANKFTATIIPPTGNTVTTTSDTSSSQNVMNNGFTYYADNYVDSNNNNRYLDMFIQRATKDANGNPITSSVNSAGTWTLSILNNGTSTITTDGWIYYTNTAIATPTISNGDSNLLIGSPGDAKTAITVASYTGKVTWFSNNTGTGTSGAYTYQATDKKIDGLSTFSSNGPLRDGTQKPDLAATGEAQISCLARGSIDPSDVNNVDGTFYRIDQGTSMASPVVAGAAALLFQSKPTATYLDIKNALNSNTQLDAVSTGAVPNYGWGNGKLDVFQALSSLLGNKVPRKTYINETIPYAFSTDASTLYSTQRIAESYTPDISGYLGGVYFHPSTTFNNITSFTIEVRDNSSGKPGNLIASKSLDPTSVAKFNWNYYDLSDLKVKITSGKDYFIVLYAGGNSPSWAIRRQATNTSNRSVLSSDNGVSWTNASVGYRIRSEVYQDKSVLSTIDYSKNDVSVYPNPAKDFVNIKLPKTQNSIVRLFDMTGKLVKEFKADSDNIQLSVSSLPKGVYLLKLEGDNRVIVKKIIKE